MIAPSRNAVLVLSFVVAASAWGWHQHRAHRRDQGKIAETQVAMAELQREHDKATEQLLALRQETATERSHRETAELKVATITRQPDRVEIDTRWTQPPMVWPSWEIESPYVWLRKEELAELGVQAIAADGSLTRELCKLLDIQPALSAAVGDLNQSIQAQWHASEAAVATRTNKHPPGMGQGKGPTVTVIVPPQPELAAQLRSDLKANLQRLIGEQRAGLLIKLAQREIARELGQEPKPNEPPLGTKVYSVERAWDDYRIETKNDPMGTGQSTSDPDWRKLIPAHLHGPFMETFGPPTIQP